MYKQTKQTKKGYKIISSKTKFKFNGKKKKKKTKKITK